MCLGYIIFSVSAQSRKVDKDTVLPAASSCSYFRQTEKLKQNEVLPPTLF